MTLSFTEVISKICFVPSAESENGLYYFAAAFWKNWLKDSRSKMYFSKISKTQDRSTLVNFSPES